jgi:prolyl oligopeptidase
LRSDSFETEVHPDVYPSVRRNDSLVEQHCYHQIRDPYRWLEDPDSDETKAYVKTLNAFSRPFFEKAYFRKTFRKKCEIKLNCLKN